MIDTVCLIIPRSDLVFLDDPNNVLPQWNLQSRTQSHSKYVRNPSKPEKETGLYFPRLTSYDPRFGQPPSVKIEFSVPKLIFNNNLEELSDTDFTEVINELQNRLLRMGMQVSKKILASAPVTTVHFSKNIQLTDGYTSSYVISALSKIDLRKSFDFAQKHFINNGQSLQAHTRSHELVIYDKIADLAKLKKRAIDKDQTSQQLSLFNSLQKQNASLEILRIEIRICNKRKLNSVFKRLKLAHNPTFRDVFSSRVAVLVLNDYWDLTIKAGQLALFSIDQTPKDHLREMCRGDPKIKPKQMIYQVGLLALSKDANGLRELRSILERHANDRTWYRIKNDFKVISEKIFPNQLRSWLICVEKQLKTYKPLAIIK